MSAHYPEGLGGYAAKRFASIVEWARVNNPFYRRWIRAADTVPIVGRATVAAQNAEILNGNASTGKTSGSTGTPIEVSHTARWKRMAHRDEERFVRMLGGTMPSLAIIRPASNAPPPGVVDVVSPLDVQISEIRRYHATHDVAAIVTYPTNAERLCGEIVRRNARLPFIRRFGLYAESFDSELEELIVKAFPGVQLWSTYSSAEFGMIAARCVHQPDYHHIMAHRLLLEVLDNNDEPCEPGHTGRVVITDYFNRAFPLIRYDIGDLAERGVCPCGASPLPALRRVYGKVYNALVHRDGNRMVFNDLSHRLKRVPGIRQFQVVQKSIEEFQIRAVPDDDDDAHLVSRVEAPIRDAFRAFFGYSPEKIDIVPTRSIERHPNGKFFASICEIP